MCDRFAELIGEECAKCTVLLFKLRGEALISPANYSENFECADVCEIINLPLK